MATNPTPLLSSTQGTTLVESGEVIAIDSTDQRTAAPQMRLTVRLTNGQVRSYPVDAATGWRIGDRIEISNNRGRLSISRQ